MVAQTNKGFDGSIKGAAPNRRLRFGLVPWSFGFFMSPGSAVGELGRWTNMHMRLKMRTRELQILTAVAAVFPLLVLTDFFSFVLQVASELNRWPRFGDPDPKTMMAALWRFRIALGLTSFPLVSLAALILAWLARRFSRDFASWIMTGVTLASAGLLAAVIRFDPGGFLNWFFD